MTSTELIYCKRKTPYHNELTGWQQFIDHWQWSQARFAASIDSNGRGEKTLFVGPLAVNSWANYSFQWFQRLRISKVISMPCKPCKWVFWLSRCQPQRPKLLQIIGTEGALAILVDFWLGQQTQKLKQNILRDDLRGLPTVFVCSLWHQGQKMYWGQVDCTAMGAEICGAIRGLEEVAGWCDFIFLLMKNTWIWPMDN